MNAYSATLPTPLHLYAFPPAAIHPRRQAEKTTLKCASCNKPAGRESADENGADGEGSLAPDALDGMTIGDGPEMNVNEVSSSMEQTRTSAAVEAGGDPIPPPSATAKDTSVPCEHVPSSETAGMQMATVHASVTQAVAPATPAPVGCPRFDWNSTAGGGFYSGVADTLMVNPWSSPLAPVAGSVTRSPSKSRGPHRHTPMVEQMAQQGTAVRAGTLQNVIRSDVPTATGSNCGSSTAGMSATSELTPTPATGGSNDAEPITVNPFPPARALWMAAMSASALRSAGRAVGQAPPRRAPVPIGVLPYGKRLTLVPGGPGTWTHPITQTSAPACAPATCRPSGASAARSQLPKPRLWRIIPFSRARALP